MIKELREFVKECREEQTLSFIVLVKDEFEKRIKKNPFKTVTLYILHFKDSRVSFVTNNVNNMIIEDYTTEKVNYVSLERLIKEYHYFDISSSTITKNGEELECLKIEFVNTCEISSIEKNCIFYSLKMYQIECQQETIKSTLNKIKKSFKTLIHNMPYTKEFDIFVKYYNKEEKMQIERELESDDEKNVLKKCEIIVDLNVLETYLKDTEFITKLSYFDSNISYLKITFKMKNIKE